MVSGKDTFLIETVIQKSGLQSIPELFTTIKILTNNRSMCVFVCACVCVIKFDYMRYKLVHHNFQVLWKIYLFFLKLSSTLINQ